MGTRSRRKSSELTPDTAAHHGETEDMCLSGPANSDQTDALLACGPEGQWDETPMLDIAAAETGPVTEEWVSLPYNDTAADIDQSAPIHAAEGPSGRAVGGPVAQGLTSMASTEDGGSNLDNASSAVTFTEQAVERVTDHPGTRAVAKGAATAASAWNVVHGTQKMATAGPDMLEFFDGLTDTAIGVTGLTPVTAPYSLAATAVKTADQVLGISDGIGDLAVNDKGRASEGSFEEDYESEILELRDGEGDLSWHDHRDVMHEQGSRGAAQSRATPSALARQRREGAAEEAANPLRPDGALGGGRRQIW